MNLAELMLGHALRSPGDTAIRMGESHLTYGKLAARTDEVAAGLRDLGVRRGDRVLMFADNSPEHLVTYGAVARLGAVFVPVHPSFQTDELDYVLSNTTPTVVVAE